MDSKLPHFAREPLVETALGVQFRPLDGFRAAHLGAFWARLGKDQWPKLSEALAIGQTTESLVDDASWASSLSGLRFSQAPEFRFQARSADDQRMFQLENGWLVYNWRRQPSATYPRYDQTRAQFDALFHALRRFLSDEGLGTPEPNLWELAYINQIPRGEAWSQPADIASLFPNLLAPRAPTAAGALQSIGVRSSFALPEKRGRLRLTLDHARRNTAPAEEIVQLMLVARGEIKEGALEELNRGLDLAHRTINSTFLEVCSDKARRLFGYQP